VSVHENTQEEHEVVFLCNESDIDTIAACSETEDTVLICEWEPGPGDYARKINYGFSMTLSPYVFLGADDLEFTRGWEMHAISVAEKQQVGVIGTDDDANPMVKRGKHSTHTLVTRAYIDEQGGTWHDGPGVVYCEEYDHQFVDTELVQAAIDRDQWAFSKRSLVRHLHPFFGGLPMDDVYKKALAHGREDSTLFLERQKRARRR